MKFIRKRKKLPERWDYISVWDYLWYNRRESYLPVFNIFWCVSFLLYSTATKYGWFIAAMVFNIAAALVGIALPAVTYYRIIRPHQRWRIKTVAGLQTAIEKLEDQAQKVRWIDSALADRYQLLAQLHRDMMALIMSEGVTT